MPSKPTIQGVVFDLDGLMFNTEEIFHHAGCELMRRRGKEMTAEIVMQMMGRRAHEAFAILVEMLELTESIDDLLAESREIFMAMLDRELAPMPGLYELLDHIEDRGLPKGVATSSGRSYLEHVLGRFDLLPRFQTLLTAEDVTHGKPHPEIYLTAADRLAIAPTSMLVLEDSQTGTQAGVAARAHVVSVPHQHSRSHDFSSAIHIAEGLHDPFIFELLRG